ncbi:MAG: hypothetical protein HC795_07025 [Coleofasciculaceae cyanobacterium RL_1_1]|nr:hypothetical protein [Coleofasciculaceae cyanobacterium RL_1_1]
MAATFGEAIDRLFGCPTKLADRWVFLDALTSGHRRNGSELFNARPTNSHPPALAQKSSRGNAHHTKTDVVVAVIAIVVVANRRTAVPRIVVPGAAAQQLCCPPQV